MWESGSLGVHLCLIQNEGNEQLHRYKSKVRVIHLPRRRATYVDLKPLESCNDLVDLCLSKNKLQTIDLSPLKKCDELQELYLGGNQLRTIDLSPLNSCKNLRLITLEENLLQSINLCESASLEILNLSGNKLKSIDLSPISSCRNLQYLYLNGNQLDKINLSPLSACSNLHSLWLSQNQIHTIDLSPLNFCPSLRKIDVSANQFQSIDMTPLSGNLKVYSYAKHTSWLRCDDASYGRPSARCSWRYLRQVAEGLGEDYRVQQDIISALGLERYGFIDYNLRDFFLRMSPNKTDKEAQKRVTNLLVKKIVSVVDRGGSTTGLRLEELLTQHNQIAVRAHRIIDLRNEEIEQIVTSVNGDNVNLRELWLTSYGYDILNALDMSLNTDSKGFEQVQSAFAAMGFHLKTGKRGYSGIRMSNLLKQAIWWIAENKGKKWAYIK